MPAASAAHLVRVGPAEFDGTTGRLCRLGDVQVDSPQLDLWRAPIDNDRFLQGSGSYGPGVLPQYDLRAAPATFHVVMRPFSGGVDDDLPSA
ncbi:hypothetical protein AB0J35_32045 [Nonomuraea angiospora]|uniref:hypothetical protein n=1 Tax=Nonomuraea angiospora TaxID=46172 RepID=UPI003429A6D4